MSREAWTATETVVGVTVRVEIVSEPRAIYQNAQDAARFFIETEPQDGREHFRVLFLDTRHRALGPAYTVSVGSLTASLVHPRELFRPAVVAGAAALILSHNHPSGDPEPSAEDLALTRRLVASGALMGIEVLDHIVTGAGRYVSLKDRGAL